MFDNKTVCRDLLRAIKTVVHQNSMVGLENGRKNFMSNHWQLQSQTKNTLFDKERNISQGSLHIWNIL